MTDLPFKPLALAPLWHDDLPERMSASQISMLSRCPEQYRQRYVKHIKAPPGPALIVGNGFGHSIEEHLEKYSGDAVGLTADEVGELFVTKFDKEVEDAGGLNSVQWRKDGRVSLPMARKMAGSEKDTGVKLAVGYRKGVAPQYQDEVIGTENEITLTDPTWAVDITGYTDIETHTELIELKTAARKNSKPRGDWVVQGRIYQLAVAKPFWWHQAVKTKDPYVIGHDQAMMEPVDLDLRDRTRLLVARSQLTLSNLYHSLGPDEPWPDAIAHPWACGFCGYRESCFWWGGKG